MLRAVHYWLSTVSPLAVLVLVLAGSFAETAREMRVVMGTVAEVRVSGTLEPERLMGAAFARIEETEASLSIWIEKSEISRLNEAGEAVLSALAFHAVAKSLEMARASNGGFPHRIVLRTIAQHANRVAGYQGRACGPAERLVGHGPQRTTDVCRGSRGNRDHT